MAVHLNRLSLNFNLQAYAIIPASGKIFYSNTPVPISRYDVDNIMQYISQNFENFMYEHIVPVFTLWDMGYLEYYDITCSIVEHYGSTVLTISMLVKEMYLDDSISHMLLRYLGNSIQSKMLNSEALTQNVQLIVTQRHLKLN